MNNIILDKTYFTEIPIAASSTTQQNMFPILQVLDNKVTQGIETYNPVDVTKTMAGNTPANMALIRASFLVLVVGDVSQIYLPLVSLINVRNGTAAAITSFNAYKNELNNLKVIWAKSYVFIADVTKVAGSAESFQFVISYTDPT
jgi:hypothetical protein